MTGKTPTFLQNKEIKIGSHQTNSVIVFILLVLYSYTSTIPILLSSLIMAQAMIIMVIF